MSVEKFVVGQKYVALTVPVREAGDLGVSLEMKAQVGRLMVCQDVQAAGYGGFDDDWLWLPRWMDPVFEDAVPVIVPDPSVTVCGTAHALVLKREEVYGKMDESWAEIGKLTELLSSPKDSSAQKAVLGLIATKLIRRKHSPQNRDHYVDLCGYAEILWRNVSVPF